MTNETPTTEPNRAALAMARRIIEMEVAASRPVDGAADLIVEMITSRMRVTDTGDLHLMQDDGVLPMWSDYINETPLTVKEYVSEIKRSRSTLFRADEQRGSITVSASTPSTSTVTSVPAGSGKPNLTELMRMAKVNPALRQQMIDNPPGGQASSQPNLTALMTAAKRGDAAALATLNSKYK